MYRRYRERYLLLKSIGNIGGDTLKVLPMLASSDSDTFIAILTTLDPAYFSKEI